MTIGWISLSTGWSLSSIQAALNVFVSVLGTVGIWAFSRYWWQQGCKKLLRGSSGVPLRALFALSSPGEGWDIFIVLRTRLFSRQNWHLLLQLVVIVTATLACILSGPIAKVSLRTVQVIQKSEIEGLKTVSPARFLGNALDAEVTWNETMTSLDRANFPFDQLLDFLPSPDSDWTYVLSEWDPTWAMACNFTPETIVQNVSASGNHTLYEPLDAFPAFRDTYDPSWLNKSKYRIQVDMEGWLSPSQSFKDEIFFILIQSDPKIDDRMNTNNATLEFSISALHLQNFQAMFFNDSTDSAVRTWQLYGPVGNASFTRAECSVIPRKLDILNNYKDNVTWPWTNDTYAITLAYRQFWSSPTMDNDSKNITVLTPTSYELVRFYQSYMASVNTFSSFPSLQSVSVWMDTVQLSVVFMAIIIILSCLTLWETGSYFYFLRRHKAKLSQVFVPDGKTDWMIHNARIAAHDAGEDIEGKLFEGRDHLESSSFGYINVNSEILECGVRPPPLARVYTNRASISAASHNGIEGSIPAVGQQPLTCTIDEVDSNNNNGKRLQNDQKDEEAPHPKPDEQATAQTSFLRSTEIPIFVIGDCSTSSPDEDRMTPGCGVVNRQVLTEDESLPTLSRGTSLSNVSIQSCRLELPN